MTTTSNLINLETWDDSGDYSERRVNRVSYGGENNPDEVWLIFVVISKQE